MDSVLSLQIGAKRLLRAELHNLKKQSALKCQTGSLDRQIIIDSNRSCARCRSDLGRILNRGAPCRACKLRVCKGCREFTNRTDWLCIVCHKQIELQSATGEWMNTEIIHTPPRRSSITQPGYIPTAEIIKKSISRSWTISNPEDDQLPNGKNGIDTRIVHPNLHSHEPSSYPNLIRLNKSPYNSNMDFNNPDNYERTPPTQRRVLRQSTLPNPDSSLHSSCLKIPSPKQQMSPQYSPYHTDNENEPENELSQVPIPSPGQRYQIRRQSTLPCKPNDLHTSKFLSTSPNRSYCRSPDPSAVIDGNEHGSRYPPFVRQSTFPSNNGVAPEYHQRQLPTSPNRLSINKSPDSGGENGGAISPRRFMRQATLPNPDQHMKLLPTSPPKKSPQFIKRSPEFQRQNTISNPEGMNTLSVHGPKFLPISPRQKQNFLFPQPSPAPRTFLSQQHFPTMTEDQPQASVQPPHPHSKMIKVRSHSNEEYSFNRTLPLLSQQEGRRLLPEIPNRARSPSRLVRQDHVKDEGEKRSPISKTFAEAKQEMYGDNQTYESQYTNEYSELNSTFAEADESLYTDDNNYESYQHQSHPEIDQSTQLQFIADQTNQFHYDSMKITHNVRSTEVYINDSPSEYFSPEDYIKQAQKNRNRRRKSRELPDLSISTDEESKKHKPENMRSVSEDASPKTIKILPRRSFSQPEKETQKKSDSPQISSPISILSQKLNSPKKEEGGIDNVDDATKSEGPKKPIYKFPKMLEMRGDSKSFDAVVRQLIKNENKEDEDKSQSMDENIFSDKKDNKTTLNEAEIQNAVEQAASLFKKVVLQRRKERHPVEDAEMTTTTSAKRFYDEVFETEIKYPLDSDDYRLVFISSDSSEKEDDCDDTSSTTSSLAIMFDDCDWDYFEPSITKPNVTNTGKTMFNNMSPFDSPHFYRRRLSSSPLDSPIFCRRGMSESPLSIRKFRESDTGTDEEILNFESSSATSSEGFLPKEYLKAWKKNHKCLTTKKSVCRCGKSTHYVAVPVPILVPMDTFQKWNNNPDLLQLLNTSNQLLSYQHEHKNDITNTSTTSMVTAAATQYQQVMREEKLPETAKDEEKEMKRQKIGDDVSITSNISCNSNATQSRRSSQSPPTQYDNVCDKGQLSHRDRGVLSRIKKSENNLTRVNNNCTCSAAHLNETIKITNKHDTYVCSNNHSGVSEKPYTNSNLIKTASSCSSNALQSTSLSGAMISVGKLKIPESGSSDGGYLISENAFSSSDNEESCDDGDEKKTVQRSYDVAGAAQVENIISDVDTNSNSATSGSDLTDSEDTGIEENRRSKAKRFTKVFVVNKNAQMSETDSCSSSANAAPSTTEEEEDTSDNDTDTDGIKLNYMKPLESDNSDRDSVSEQEVTLNCIDASDNDDNLSENNVILNSIKTIDDNEIIEVNQHKDKENGTDVERVESEKKVNGTASENTLDDDKNKSNLPSNSDECANQMNVIDETDEIVSNCDSLEPSCYNISNRHEEEKKSIENFEMEMEPMDTIINDEKKFASCNLSMILGDGPYDNNKIIQTNDVRTGFADDENLLKIESPLNPIQHKQEQKQQHNITESDSQTTVAKDNNVPVAIETGLHQHIHNKLNVVETLLNDQCEAGSSSNNNNYILTQQQQEESNLCVKQNVNEEIAKTATQELLNVENASVSRQRSNSTDGNGKFTSLIMITQQDNNNFAMDTETQVSVTTTDTTKIITGGDSSSRDSIVVQHRNWQPRDLSSVKSKIGFYEENINKVKENLNIKVKNAPNSEKSMIKFEKSESENEIENDKETAQKSENSENGDVTVITGQKTLSAVICLEDGLADDDSWVEEMSQNDDEEFPSTETGSSDFDSSDEMSLSYSGVDREEELRGYNRVSIDFTLHTIVEESCEDSEYENSDRKSQRISASELEKYFFFGLGEGGSNSQSHSNAVNNNLKMTAEDQDESPSETSSICSEKSYSEGGLDSLNTADENGNGCGTLASSRLEKYFLTGFMGFQNNDGNDNSDGSGSVGSDSEGRPSPEQRRKKLVRARGTGRSHSSSLDNLLAKEDSLENQSEQTHQQESNDSDSSETTCDDNIDKTEYHSDTVKRKKKIKKQDLEDASKKVVPDVEIKVPSGDSEEEDEDGRKTPQPEFLMPASNNLVQSRKQHSRDSGFIGSNDDLLKSEKSDGQRSPEIKIELEEIQEEIKEPEITQVTPQQSNTNLMRKDSFNAWSSDEETNLMMSKMRQFFKSLIAANANTKNSRSSTPIEASSNGTPKIKHRQRPPQLVYFENELTRLMKTVPGIKDEQVKEFVEYFSSEDAWSDSYDSSDYTSSDKESGVKKSSKIQQQISASCQEIIEKFDRNSKVNKLDEEGDMGDGGVLEDGINKETAFVYQKLVASITKIADEKPSSNVTNSPPIIAKVMHHIGSRLVALMHEVSSGESMKSNSPKQLRHHRRLQAKISATTTEDDDSTSESNLEDSAINNLPRSKSHDLLLDGSGKPTQDHMTMEEREASDYERFSWRGSFESALLTNCDSRNKLSTLENSSSALSILAAKRRSAGDLLFSPKNLSREQLDRVRSCGSIGGDDHDLENSKLWESTQSQESSRKRAGIIEDDTDESSDNDHQRLTTTRSTLPRSLQTSTITASTTNSLPRLPTTSANMQSSSGAMQKAQSVYQFLQNNVKSARYRAPGFNRPQQPPKRALSVPGLQQPFNRRDRRNKVQSLSMDDQSTSVTATTQVISNSKNNSKTVTPTHPSPSSTTEPWPSQSDEDIDRLVQTYQNRHNSLSSLGLRSDSMASVYSGAGEGRYGTVQVKGMVEFGMQYNYKQCALEIHVKQCKDLAAVDTKRNRSDPYVKVYLLPDKTKSGKRKTKVKKHTLNPVFDEVLRFYMSLSSLESRTLWLTVWHSDMFGRNDFLGEVMISLQNKVFDNPLPQWYQLEERSEPFEDVTTYRGDIIVGLKFIPGSESSSSYSHGLSLRKFSIKSNSSSNSANNGSSATSTCSKNTKGSLHVLVKEAKHLSAVKANGNCDAFCKSYLLPDKNRSSKQKTPVVKRTTNPQWNYTFVYEDLTLAELSERALELTIWDHDRLASNEFLGGVRFSLGTGKHYGKSVEWNDANGKELTLWQSMINRPNFWVEGCLALRSSLENRTGT
ncbi:hypothetical protein PVAND_000759 [Polypedilum vanderplanki]|uniref:C2 domain-containing protein n=1 Tax=Polypedilum vanderplanki TaxID=319348 RepID=A0A9J6BKW8_POLVA|nr:hypothetical protein PVAND_000759 [Polypedilum vanderplanki]